MGLLPIKMMIPKKTKESNPKAMISLAQPIRYGINDHPKIATAINGNKISSATQHRDLPEMFLKYDNKDYRFVKTKDRIRFYSKFTCINDKP